MLLDWRPRWEREVCIPLLGCAGVQVGFDFKITLNYTWLVSDLRSVVRLRGLVMNQIDVAMRLGALTASNLKIGILKIGRLLLQQFGSRTS
jgi:hypothetical protein